MENTKKLTGKDLINVGIYTAMTLVIFFVVGLLTALPVVYPFLFIIWPILFIKSGNGWGLYSKTQGLNSTM